MNLRARIYSYMIPVLGLGVGLACAYGSLSELMASPQMGHEIFQLIVLMALSILCRCLPININENAAIDMSFICNFAMLLCKGPRVAAAVILLSTPFIFQQVRDGAGKRRCVHILAVSPLKAAFNTANCILSVYLGGQVFALLGGQYGQLGFPGVLLPALAAIFTVMLVNSVLLLLLFYLDQRIPFFPSLLSNLMDFLPSIVAAAPIGYFIARFMIMEDGEYLCILFTLLLLLTRYSFVLYLDTKRNYYVMMQTLTNAIEAKDPYTEGHSRRVQQYAGRIAEQMRLAPWHVENINMAAVLHDVGKIGVPEEILNKPARLTAEEYEVIKKHPATSVHILENIRLNEEVTAGVLHHHERYDGKGYPDGMQGDALPISAYIIAVADAYDAMTSKRPYSNGKTRQQAIEVLKQESGQQFHPAAVRAMLEVLEQEEANC